MLAALHIIHIFKLHYQHKVILELVGGQELAVTLELQVGQATQEYLDILETLAIRE